MNTDSFIKQITSQSLFNLFSHNKLTNSIQQLNKLIIRNNQDLFFVSNNVVRCCQINPYTINYKLVNINASNSGYYEIHSILLNQTGNLLAIIGSSQIDIVNLPNNLKIDGSIYVNNSSYKITNIKGEIKKVIWQSIAQNDCILVVLNDQNQISVFDISKSLNIPQLEVNLTNRLQGNITSITFGSSKNLIGGLTLYISTDQGVIYSIFPFIAKSTKIATTESAIDIALDDTKSIMSLIQDKFPTNLVDIASSPINKAVLKQFDYFQFLKSQINKGITYKEVRNFNKPYELSVVEQSLNGYHDISIQGPLVSSFKIDDLTSIYDNEQVTLLVSIGENSTINYYAQLNPLLMKFKSMEEQLTTTTKKSYVKPRKGFGFIDPPDTLTEQKQFWDTDLAILDILQSDKLDISPTSTSYFQKLNDEKMAMIIDNKFILMDLEWCKNLVESLESEPTLEISTNYDIASSGNEVIKGSGYIKDEITSTGEYLIILRDKEIDDLEVITISSTQIEPEIKLITDIPERKQIKSVSISKPFEEIESELEKLKNLKLEGSGELDGSIKSLETLNKLSNDTKKVLSSYTIYGIKLQSRISSQLELLKLQIDNISNIKSKNFNTEQQKNITQINEKQDKLNKKLESLQEKIYKSLVKINSNRSLPLSKSEKSWISEMNEMIEEIIKDDNSLTKRVENLVNQVKIIKDNNVEIDELEAIKLDKRLSKIVNWLKLEDDSIINLKTSVKNLTTKVN
ncbi:unnamed protein product [Candida verbasci]|uniref:Uncharacterized protein n=1 Tax=Candida verbasci TaxID=1227364 RepID=A0A9W4XCN9_9ASCO|nr:unnamed protein product [Candida verbasci]